MAKKTSGSKIGHYAFIAGVLLAFIVGLFPGAIGAANVQMGVIIVLVLLGLIVGFLNITGSETTQFLVASIALMGGGAALGGIKVIPVVGNLIYNVLLYVAVFVAPAALVVALKTIYSLAER